MSRNANRQIDKTYLSLNSAEERGLVHRDYIAHCLRWSHVVKFLGQGHKYMQAHILDVGCGKEMPLAKTLYVNKMTPKKYIGVDANQFGIPAMLQGKKIPISIWSETDVCALEPADVSFNPNPDGPEPMTLPNIVTCFEVLEHVTPEHCRRILEKFKELSSYDCHYFVSTPCWNGSAAGNHINEMTFGALGSLIEDLGFHIEGVYGTFASISDYQNELSAVTVYDKDTGKELSRTDLRDVFAALRNYYDTNLLSVIFAPLFPAKSRNALWHFTKRPDASVPNHDMFTKLETQPTPWSQHPNWIELSGYTHAHTDNCLDRVGADLVGNTLKCGRNGIWLPK